jgi:hypothetical protein
VFGKRTAFIGNYINHHIAIFPIQTNSKTNNTKPTNSHNDDAASFPSNHPINTHSVVNSGITISMDKLARFSSRRNLHRTKSHSVSSWIWLQRWNLCTNNNKYIHMSKLQLQRRQSTTVYCQMSTKHTSILKLWRLDGSTKYKTMQ